MIDGVSATDLLSVILGTERDASATEPDAWKAEPEPNPAQLVAHSLALRAASPYEGARTVLAAIRGPGRMARDLAGVARGLVNLRPVLAPTASSPMTEASTSG